MNQQYLRIVLAAAVLGLYAGWKLGMWVAATVVPR